MKRFGLLFSVFAIAAVVVSCQEFKLSEADHTDGLKFLGNEYSEILIDSKSAAFFSDLSFASTSPQTRSGDVEMVSLESLLDREGTEILDFEDWEITQIPFKSNRDNHLAILSKDAIEAVEPDSLTTIRQFLLECRNEVASKSFVEIATMIPDMEYISAHGADSVSFLDKSRFSGIVIFSSIEGEYRKVYIYGHGPIRFADVVAEESQPTGGNCFYINLVSAVGTRSVEEEIDGGFITASYCVASGPDLYIDTGALYTGLPTNGDQNGDWESGGVGGGGGTGGGGSDDGDSGQYDPIKYRISLYKTQGGYVHGNGLYPANSVVFCAAYPLNLKRFDRWVGHLKGLADKVWIKLESDVSATAYFMSSLQLISDRPCWDLETDTMNPLVNMSLAPTSTWTTNFRGSTYGDTRRVPNENGTLVSRKHNGLDLAASVGTPVYSMFDGVVSSDSYVTSQPDKQSNDYPAYYFGDKDGAGNRLAIASTINGVTVCMGYWHLQAGSPVAINPRTGVPFAPGDKVYQGEVIGYVGKTGNAWNVPYSHLHLACWVKNPNGSRTYVNPETYINGDVSWTNSGHTAVNSTAIINIECNG
ncbi:MAG: M23 family metallopeptidase [Bacteroidales bacterium]|nr:M23 family metallopeptidase [Bacteroidales bacterium]